MPDHPDCARVAAASCHRCYSIESAWLDTATHSNRKHGARSAPSWPAMHCSTQSAELRTTLGGARRDLIRRRQAQRHYLNPNCDHWAASLTARVSHRQPPPLSSLSVRTIATAKCALLHGERPAHRCMHRPDEIATGCSHSCAARVILPSFFRNRTLTVWPGMTVGYAQRLRTETQHLHSLRAGRRTQTQLGHRSKLYEPRHARRHRRITCATRRAASLSLALTRHSRQVVAAARSSAADSDSGS